LIIHNLQITICWKPKFS